MLGREVVFKPVCYTGPGIPVSKTYHTDLSSHQVAQSVEPVDVGLQVAGFTLPEETLKHRRRKGTLSKRTKVYSCCIYHL